MSFMEINIWKSEAEGFTCHAHKPIQKCNKGWVIIT